MQPFVKIFDEMPDEIKKDKKKMQDYVFRNCAESIQNVVHIPLNQFTDMLKELMDRTYGSPGVGTPFWNTLEEYKMCIYWALSTRKYATHRDYSSMDTFTLRAYVKRLTEQNIPPYGIPQEQKEEPIQEEEPKETGDLLVELSKEISKLHSTCTEEMTGTLKNSLKQMESKIEKYASKEELKKSMDTIKNNCQRVFATEQKIWSLRMEIKSRTDALETSLSTIRKQIDDDGGHLEAHMEMWQSINSLADHVAMKLVT